MVIFALMLCIVNDSTDHKKEEIAVSERLAYTIALCGAILWGTTGTLVLHKLLSCDFILSLTL